MMNSLIVNYVTKFVEKMNITDYIGIIVYGSYVGGRSNALSDIDVMIIKEGYETQDCGSCMVDGIRIEYFIQDLKKLYQLIKAQIDHNDPSHLTKFASCEIIYAKDNRVQELVNYSKEMYNTKIKNSFNDDEKFLLFSINNKLEDLESLLEDESFYAVYFVTLEKIRLLYAKIYGIIDLPLTKINKIYTDFDFAKKYISSENHNLPDSDFINMYLLCLKIDDKSVMLSNINQLYSLSFNSLDFNPNNFWLKYTSNAPFRV